MCSTKALGLNWFIKLLNVLIKYIKLIFQLYHRHHRPRSRLESVENQVMESSKSFINLETSHIKLNNDTLFSVAFRITSAFPIKFDYLQFDFRLVLFINRLMKRSVSATRVRETSNDCWLFMMIPIEWSFC